ncbi:MAG: lipoprotein-releasing ABC transporter permease subunit [Pseudomonadota bacterium]|nr:lipoprotein-releasing ABC transporter permease subunit [Pseudomonadota bacterium]
MKNSFPLFVGLRYLRAQKGSRLISFVSVTSIIGVSLGVATLIVVLSVMNGFEKELRNRLLSLTSHASIIKNGDITEWQEIVSFFSEELNVLGAAPFIELEAMISSPNGISAALVTGVVPNLERNVSKISQSMSIGKLTDLQPSKRLIVLGQILAQRLGVKVGESVSLLVPQKKQSGKGLNSVLLSFEVIGFFELGVQEHDSIRAVIHLDDASSLGALDGRVSGVRIETNDIFSAPEIVRALLGNFDEKLDLKVKDWTQENSSYFRAIKIEKTMMTLLLSLIIGVAGFNIVATLVMVVNEKRSGIAILRTMGCSQRDIILIFLIQGILISWFGALIGIVFGILITLNVDTLAPHLEQIFGFQFMPSDLYYLNALPVDLKAEDVFITTIIVLSIALISTLYPAFRAASVEPSEVLRYE